MPTYEYRCQRGHVFEEIQKISDPPVASCPACGGKAERQISAGAALIFKGPGFYITDYRSESYKKGEAADAARDPTAGAPPAASQPAQAADATKPTSEAAKPASDATPPRSSSKSDATDSRSRSKASKPRKDRSSES